MKGRSGKHGAMTMAELNAADRAAFTGAVGFVFEHSPWIAERAWESRPFDSVDRLHASMMRVIDTAPRDRQIALITAHPDLAGRVARDGQLTAASTSEQSAAGLDRLTRDEMQRFDQLNDAYKKRFGFPFVICARERDKHAILQALERRLDNSAEDEMAAALEEIGKIARLRLADAVTDA